MTPTAKTSLRSRDLVLPLIAAALVLFPGLGQTPFRRAEIYFADVARAMVERADWLIPHFRGVPFFDKPALTYWFLASSFKVFGFSSGAARVPSALAALLVMAVTVWISWLLWKDRASAVAAGWILIATIPFVTFGGIAMSDMLLTLWTTLAIAAGLLCYRSEESPLPLIALGAVLGLGFLTKGPIALLVPGIGLLSLVWQQRRLPPLSLPTVLAGVLVFLSLGFGWFVLVYLIMGMDPIKFFFVRENLQRFSGAVHDIGRPVWFYLITYLGQGAPWSLLLPLAAVRFLRREPDGEARMLLLWIFLVTVLLSLSHGKVDYYLLPLYPAIAMIVGRYVHIAVWNKLERYFAASILGLAGVAFMLLPLVLFRIPQGWRPSGVAIAAAALGFLAAGLACILALLRPEPIRAFRAFVFSVCVGSAIITAILLPSFYAGQPNQALIAAASRERRGRPDLTFAAHEDPTQLHRDLLFYSRLVVEETADLSLLARSSRPYLLLASPAEAASLKATTPVRELASYPYLPLKFFTFNGILADVQPQRLVLLANFDL